MILSEQNKYDRTKGARNAAHHKMHDFVSDSEWDARAVIDQAARDVAQCLPGEKLTGLLIDESGVDHPYSNSQTAVFGCLCNGKYASLVDSRLYLPKSWTNNLQRCKEAGIPIGERTFKTKSELALDIIKHQTALGVEFDYVNANGIYGDDFNFTQQIDKMGLFYMLDVHPDQELYLGKPELDFAQHESGKGWSAKNLNPDTDQTTPAQYEASLKASQWQNFSNKDTDEGVLKGKFHFKSVYVWNETTTTFESRLLVISKHKTPNGEELKYSLTNAPLLPYTYRPIAYMQAHRFYVAHSFKEQKQIMGIDQFQAHKWLSWYHQVALNILVGYFKLKEQLLNRRYCCYQPGI